MAADAPASLELRTEAVRHWHAAADEAARLAYSNVVSLRDHLDVYADEPAGQTHEWEDANAAVTDAIATLGPVRDLIAKIARFRRDEEERRES